jgi:hypothetical protein
MEASMSMNHGTKHAAFGISIVFLLAASAAVFAQAAIPAPVSGTIVSVNGSSLILALADQTRKTVALQGSTLVLERDTAELSQIRAGDPLAVTSHRSGPDLVASNINIFSKEVWDVVRKGQWKMATGDMMTNAMVSEFAQGVSGHTLTMKYADGTSTITVPDGIPIHRLVTVKPSALMVGMQVMVRGNAGSDGTLTAGSISFDGPAKS